MGIRAPALSLAADFSTMRALSPLFQDYFGCASANLLRISACPVNEQSYLRFTYASVL
jgi:hypothetical protein